MIIKCNATVYKILALGIRTYMAEIERWKTIFHANDDQKRARMAILVAHKIVIKSKHCNKRQIKTL